MIAGSAVRFLFFLFSSGIIAGFLVGSSIAIYTIVVRNYVSYELYFLSAWAFKDQINSWIGIALLACTIATGVAAVVFFLSHLASGQDRRSALFRVLYTAGLCLAASAWAVYALHQNWGYFAPGKYHVKVFVFDVLALAGIALLGWLSVKLKLSRLLPRTGPALRVCAALVLVTAGVVNAGLFVYAAYCLPERPNVILISIDALRADHVGCYGYHRNTTPHIDAFARGSVIFKNAFVHDGWTLPSHMSMLTGLYSMTHGVGAQPDTVLPAGILTVAELLKNAGYTTMGFVNGAFWMHPFYGFGRGFDFYNLSLSYSPESPERNAEYQNKFIQRHVRSRKGKNNFIFIHYFDVHSDTGYLPYDSPPPYSSMFTDSNVDLFDGVDHDYRATNYLSYLNREKVMPDPDRLEHIIGLYDNSIAYMDKCIGDLFAMLQEQGLYDDSIIIITADHGEAFGEHGFFGHGSPYQYEEDIHVPLIIKLPDSSEAPGAEVIESIVEHIDIVPTIFDYLAIQGFPMDGTSLRGIIEKTGDAKEYINGLTSRTSLYIRSMTWKLMSDKGLNRNHYRLYNIENDPNEQHTVALDYPEIEEYLEDKLRTRIEESLELRTRLLGSERAVQGADSGRKLQLDNEEQERLRSLGYIL